MNYKVNWSNSEGAFAVPDNALDSIKLASGKNVKVLLYIMKFKTASTENAAEIASLLDKNMTAEDVEDSLSFWEQVGILCQAGTSPKIQSEIKAENEPKPVPKTPLSPARAVERATKMLTPSEIAEKINSSQEIAFLFSGAEAILGRALTNTDQRSLIHWVEYYSLGCDIILMLIEYCKSINKTSINYIQAIVQSWAEKEINTHELADAEIKKMQKNYSLEGKIKTRLELNRALTTKELEFVNEWSSKGVSIELIELAYERTVQATGKAAFPYMNKIIENWLNENIRTPAAVEKYEQKRAASVLVHQTVQKNEINTHSYDLDKLLEHAKNNIPSLKGDQ